MQRPSALIVRGVVFFAVHNEFRVPDSVCNSAHNKPLIAKIWVGVVFGLVKTKHNIAQLAGSGVDGVALVSAIFSAPDIESECRLLRRLSEEMVNA